MTVPNDPILLRHFGRATETETAAPLFRRLGFQSTEYAQVAAHCSGSLLVQTVCAQSASYADEHETHHAGEHCCRLCHIGPAPIAPAVFVAVAAPIQLPF